VPGSLQPTRHLDPYDLDLFDAWMERLFANVAS
jgi:hypothetical protein